MIIKFDKTDTKQHNFQKFTSFRGKLPKSGEKIITDETLKLVSATAAAVGFAGINYSNMHRMTPEDKENIIDLYKQGISVAAICGTVPFKQASIYQLINEQPNAEELKSLHKENSQKFSKEQIENMIKLRREGTSLSKIGELYGVSDKKIISILKSNTDIDKLNAEYKLSQTSNARKNITEIITAYKNGASQKELGKKYGCKDSMIGDIISEQDNAEEIRAIHKQNRNRKGVSDADIQEIITLYLSGMTSGQIAKKFSEEKFKISKASIMMIINDLPNADEIKKQAKKNQVNTKKKYSLEKKLAMLEMYKQGAPFEEIERVFECNSSVVDKFIDTQPKPEKIRAEHMKNSKAYLNFSEQDIDYIIHSYKNGITLKKLAEPYGCSEGPIIKIINNQPNAKELKEEHKKNSKYFFTVTEEEKNDIINSYSNGLAAKIIAIQYSVNKNTILRFIKAQGNADEIIESNRKNSSKYICLTEEQKKEITELYKEGYSPANIAPLYSCSDVTIKNFLKDLPDAKELKKQYKQNNGRYVNLTEEQKKEIVTLYKNGMSQREIAENVIGCSPKSIRMFLLKETDYKKKYTVRFWLTENEQKEILKLRNEGVGYRQIAKSLSLKPCQVWKFIKHEEAKKLLHKKENYEDCTILDLKNRLYELLLNEKIFNDELLEQSMNFLDTKQEYDNQETLIFIDFLKLLDKVDNNTITIQEALNTQTAEIIFSWIDEENEQQESFENAAKEFSKITNNTFCENNLSHLREVCLKYLPKDINDTENIRIADKIIALTDANLNPFLNKTYKKNKYSVQKYVNNIITAIDILHSNPNLQEKYINLYQAIFDAKIPSDVLQDDDFLEQFGQMANIVKVFEGTEKPHPIFKNEYTEFVDFIKTLNIANESKIKHLLKLEDYFDTTFIEDNSINNFEKVFDQNLIINQKIKNEFINKIYKKTNTYKTYYDPFLKKNIKVVITPEAKQKVLSAKWNQDKYNYLTDSDVNASLFADSRLGSPGIKRFVQSEEGLIAEIKVSGFGGARLWAKLKSLQDEIYYFTEFKPDGFHDDKK